MFKKSTLLCLLLFPFSSIILIAQKDYTKLVNPFIGTGGHGHTYPGATSPFGMVQLSPDTRMADWDGSSGYHYSDSIIYGFSHTHLSGTGVPDYCDILLQPTTGEYEWDKQKYASRFKHASEKAYAGFYGVHLDKYNINVQLTTTPRTGLHRYVFPQNTKEGNVIVDLIHRDVVLDSYLEVVDNYTIKGYRFSKSWATNQKLFFKAKFNKPIIKKALHIGDEATKLLSAHIAQGKAIQAGFSFDVSDGTPLMVQVALSPVSMEGAALNLTTEQSTFDFDKTLQQNVVTWNKELSKIDIESHSFHNIDTIFYSALYHMMIVPNIYQDVDGQYRGTDDKIHKAEGYTHYTVFSLWDTYRAYHPMMSIIDKKRTRDWIHTFLNMYKQGGMLPVWELSANETFCMIGYHSVPVIVDAYKKGIRDFDTDLALEAMLSYSKSNRFSIDQYAKRGFLSNEIEHESVSKTMEYAYDDWCIAEFAKMLGKEKIAQEYYKRSLNYRNLYNPTTGFFQGKLHGAWYNPFDPNEINNFYTEGNAWHYSLAAPHDIWGMIDVSGGRLKLNEHLVKMFDSKQKTTGREQADVTGLIGQYAHGNEPSHHMAYLYRYSTEPDKTGYFIDKICKEFYKNTPDGLIGNEDCGQMSAWYIWSALGFYPVNPASNTFITGCPQLSKAIVKLENGKQIIINAPKGSTYPTTPRHWINDSSTNYIRFEELMNGNEIKVEFLEWVVGSIAIKRNILDQRKYISDNYVAVPFIAKGDVKFKDKTTVELGSIDKENKIYFYIAPVADNGATEWHTKYTLYKKPIVLKNNSTIHFYSYNGKNTSSKVTQSFFKLPTDKTITVLSKVNPMYTAGGNESLIDGIKGTVNWRAGEWQSYYGNDFEAVIDVKKIKNINTVTATFLQDNGSWIWMPTQMEVYTSNDNKRFSLVKTVYPKTPIQDDKTVVEELQVNLKAAKTRYIKIVAKNFGTIPSWHLGAGNQSHLFVSEIVVK